MPVGTDKFDVNRCSESPLWGEKPDFWPVSKFNTGSLPLRGILPVITHDTTECRRALDIVTLAGNCFSTLPLTKILLGVAYLMRPLDAGYCYCFFPISSRLDQQAPSTHCMHHAIGQSVRPCLRP